MASSQALMAERGENGVPLKSDYDAMCPAPGSLFVLYTKFTGVFATIGVLVGVGMWNFGSSAIMHEKLALISHFQLGPLYLSLFVLKYAFQMISANMGHARRACRINNPDQQVYRVFGGPDNGATVLMDTEGDFGKFNRAQRALANLEEVLPLFLVEMAFVGFVFPLLTTALVVLFSVARFVGARGYTEAAKSRTSGNFTSFLAMGLLDGLSIFIGVLVIRGVK